MTTAEALEGMTDAGEFEILALRVLRITENDCKDVIHLGVNAQGKTIANPVDGFCLVPGSDPPKYVFVAFTQCKERDLRGKWLFEGGAVTGIAALKKRGPASRQEDGDLLKAARHAAKLRKATPNAEFIVYLCTNRVPAGELIDDVNSKAEEFNLQVRFLERSKLRDFLDADPEGQWLRQEHLGIEADQLSRPLLQHLSRITLERYAAEMLFVAPAAIVETSAGREVRQATREPTLHLCALVGPSGVGKTVAAFEILRQHLDAEGLGLWIGRETAERATTLADAIEEVLRASHPRLEKGAGEKALRLGTVESPVLIVIDDVNRSPVASVLIQKIVGWARLAQGGVRSDKVEPSSVRLLCPVWDSNYQANLRLLEPKQWLRVQSLGPLLRGESADCLRVALGDVAARFADLELERFAELLKDDPILLGLFADSLKKQPEVGPLALAQDVIGNWVEHAAREVAAKSGFAAPQYTCALRQVSSEMIRRKALYPKWAELEEWFISRQQIPTLIGQLAAQGAVCRLSNADGTDEFQFRHDRILEYHLRVSFSEMLAQEPQDDSVWDPFFLPYMAWALAHGTHSPGLLKLAVERAPVALIAAIEHLPGARSGRVDAILAKARDWLEIAPGALPSIRDDAYGLLGSIESPHVLALTEGLGNDQRLLFGRLRNGDAASGAVALSKRFYPAIHHRWLERLIQQAKLRHGSKLVSRLRQILGQKELEDCVRSGALILTGYVGDDSLATAVMEGWGSAPSRNRFLLETLWAGLRCASSAPEKLLPPVFAAVLELEESDRETLLENLPSAARHGFSEAVLKFLTGLGQREEYQKIVVAILERTDHPIAVDFVVRTMALWSHSAREDGGISPWALSWAELRMRGGPGGPMPLSPASADALRSLWQEEGNPDWLREYALDVWAEIGGELCFLQSIPETSTLCGKALWHRAHRGDRTVVSQVIAMLGKKIWWLELLPKVWCKEAAEALDHHFSFVKSDEVARSNCDHFLAETLRDIPVSDAERLLFKHWPRLCRNPLYIQTALYLSTDESRARAAESVRLMGADASVFRLVSMFFGFWVAGLSDRLSIRHLESLRPYVDRLDPVCIEHMLRFCQSHGYRDWAREVLQPECSRRAKAAETREYNRFDWDFHLSKWHFPTEADLLERLDGAEKAEPRQRSAELWRWSEGFAERGDSPDRLFRLAEQWLKGSPSLDRFKIVASLVKERGTRQHLSILQSCAPACDTPEGRLILADASYAVRRRSLA